MKFLYENFFAILFTCTYKYNSANRKYQKEEIEFNNTFLGETKNDTENKSSIN